jgi:hypothetical protein
MVNRMRIGMMVLIVFALVWVPLATTQAASPTPAAAPAKAPSQAATSSSEKEPNNRFSLANPVAASGSVTGKIDPKGDHDWYRFDVAVPGELHTTIKNPEPEAAKMAMMFRLFNANVEQILGWQGPPREGVDTDIFFDVTTAGTYYLELAESNDDMASGKPYAINLAFTPGDDPSDPNHHWYEAAPAAFDTPIENKIFPRGEHDWYSVVVSVPGELHTTIKNPEAEEAKMAMNFRIFNENLAQVLGWQGPQREGIDTENFFDLTTAGTYYLELAESNDDARSLKPYTLNLSFLPGDDAYDPSAHFRQAAELKSGEPLEAKIFPIGEHDWFWFKSPGRVQAQIVITPPDSHGQMASRVYNKGVEQIVGWQVAPRAGANTDFIFDLKDEGIYYVEVAKNNDDQRFLTPYTLALSLTPVSDVTDNNNNFMNAMPIELGATVSASIFPQGEHDWYKLSVPSLGEFHVVFANSPKDLTMACRVFDADGSQVVGWQTAQRAGADLESIGELKEPGTYYIEVAQSNDSARSLENYNLSTSLKKH